MLVSRRLSATGIRFLGILFPPGDWASLTVGLPACIGSHRSPPDPDGVSTFHTRKTRLGLGALCIPGITVSTRSSMCPRPPPAASQRQRPCPPSTTTRPGRFESRDISEGFRTSPHASLPLTRCPWTVQGPLGFPVSSAPSRCRPRTSRWGRVLDTDPKSRRRHQSTSNRRTHLQRATSCRSTGFKHCSPGVHTHLNNSSVDFRST